VGFFVDLPLFCFYIDSMKLATYETISEILPIEGADRIELARVQGWQSVIRKGEFKVGDQVIFVPIDTVLTPSAWNEHLQDKKDPSKPIRLKTVKLRGVVSQGLILRATLVSAQEIWDHSDDPEEDTSLAGMLGITKYEKPVPVQLRGQVQGNFPTHLVSKTDEDNLKSNIKVLEELKEADEIEVTLKIDGTSATYIKELDGTFRVCSRNLELKDTEESVYWQMARKYDVVNNLLPGYAIQGEISGPGIQGNPDGSTVVTFCVFNVINLYFGKPLARADWHLAFNDIEKVKKVCLNHTWTKEQFADMDIDRLQNFVNGITYVNKKPAEGLVFRGIKDGKIMYSEKLQKMLSVKIINQNYKD
jgi:RNA ligase (TIGR02306 family)